MNPFEYIRVTDIEQACGLLRTHRKDARILAGGTDLLIELRRPAVRTPRLVVDISSIASLRGITKEDSAILLGPLTTHTELLTSSLLASVAPILRQAAAGIGSPQIRNRGTVGGNIMNAAACADTVPPLVALGGVAVLRSSSGERAIPLQELFVRPYETRAAEDELLSAIRFPVPRPSMTGAFLKLGRRNALAISRLSVAAMVDRSADGHITEARIVPGAALPTWMRVTDAEALLIGERPSKKLFAAAALKVAEIMIHYTGRRWSTEYKEPVLPVLVRRALESCCGGMVP